MNIHFQVYGLSGELEKNVHAQLSSIQKNKIILDEHFRAQVDNAVRKGLKALGYYEPTINFKLPLFTKEKDNTFIIYINPGKPVLIGGTNVVLRGDASNDQDYLDILSKRPTVGTVLNHSDYDNFKKLLTNIALKKGYFDSQFNKSQLGYVLSKHQAFWDIDYDSGQRYRFGTITFEGSQILDEYLRNLIPFREGDYYNSIELVELNQRLSSTGWFNSIVITPEFDKSRKSKILPLHVSISPRIENIVETGIGYSTDTGPRVKVSWKKPWVNSYGHSLTNNASTSISEQKINFSYKVPILKKPLKQYFFIKSGFKRTNLSDTKSDFTTFSISRHWDLSSGWKQAINLHWSLNHFSKENINNTSMLIYTEMLINNTHLYGGLIPAFIHSQRYSISYSNAVWGSDINFLILKAQNIYIKNFFDRHRIVIRSNLSWIESKNLNKIPQNLRFFAENDHNIRGCNYKFFSRKEDNKNLIRSSKLVIESLEYQYNFFKKWWSAIFIDNGRILTNIHHNNVKTGAGFGIRLESKAGKIKFDFALPISSEKKGRSLQFYIGLEPEL